MPVPIESPIKVTSKTTKAQLENALYDVVRNFNEYREQVKALAEEHKDAEGWCEEGFAKAMKALGLNEPTNLRKVNLGFVFDLAKYAEDFGEDLEELRKKDDNEILLAAIAYAGNLADNRLDFDTLDTYSVESVEEHEEPVLLAEKPLPTTRRSSRYSDFHDDGYGYGNYGYGGI